MRRGVDRLVVAVAATCAVIACGVLVALLTVIFVRGFPAISWTFLTEPMQRAGAAGGIVHNIIGTLLLLITAAAICTPLAVGIALTHSVYAQASSVRRRLELILYTWNGIPSILFGLFGLIVFVQFLGWGKSWLSGGILLALLMVPTAAVALIERMRALPDSYVETATGLGLSRTQVVWAVVLPQSAGGLVTGLLLGLARVAGETAPIMFTATIFAGATWPRGVQDSPVLSMPYHVFVLAQDSFDPAVGERVWATATVLLLLVVALSAAALPLRLRQSEEAQHG